jgi:hypothetical protein
VNNCHVTCAGGAAPQSCASGTIACGPC